MAPIRTSIIRLNIYLFLKFIFRRVFTDKFFVSNTNSASISARLMNLQ